MAPRPPEGLFLRKRDRPIAWLVQAVHRLEESVMATLAELQDQVASLKANETAQTATLNGLVTVNTGLTSAVGALIAKVGELRRNLSPAEQAQVDAMFAEVSDTLAGTAQQGTVLADQAAALQALAQQANNAAADPDPST